MVTSIQKDKYETAERPWQVRFSIVSKLTNFQIPFKNRTLFSPEYLKTFFKWYDFCLVPIPWNYYLSCFQKHLPVMRDYLKTRYFLDLGVRKSDLYCILNHASHGVTSFSNGFRFAMETSKWRILWLPGINFFYEDTTWEGQYDLNQSNECSHMLDLDKTCIE